MEEFLTDLARKCAFLFRRHYLLRESNGSLEQRKVKVMETSETVGGVAGGGIGAKAGWDATEGKPIAVRVLGAAVGTVVGAGAGVLATRAFNTAERAVGHTMESTGRCIADSGSRTGNTGVLMTGVVAEQTGRLLVRDSKD